ncbi:hypothetical protein [Antrihabitans spumae]|uniref:Arsenate reductase n=1 Tax=Antrihabitans spumae TaxID=3373370 RepID=A0ABW7JZM4_9NOCA
MTINELPTDWVPTACSLPTVQQPLRVAEFDELFARSVQDLTRFSATRLDLQIVAAEEQRARELTERESGCCSFFVFRFAPVDGDLVHLSIEVPAAYIDVLDSLTQRVQARIPNGGTSA